VNGCDCRKKPAKLDKITQVCVRGPESALCSGPSVPHPSGLNSATKPLVHAFMRLYSTNDAMSIEVDKRDRTAA
jgi:hypothetical protein